MGAEANDRMQNTGSEIGGGRASEEWICAANNRCLKKGARKKLHTSLRPGRVNVGFLSPAWYHKPDYTQHYAYTTLHVNCICNSLLHTCSFATTHCLTDEMKISSTLGKNDDPSCKKCDGPSF